MVRLMPPSEYYLSLSTASGRTIATATAPATPALPVEPLRLISHIATSNDPWGPTGTEMAEIAGMTFSRYMALVILSK